METRSPRSRRSGPRPLSGIAAVVGVQVALMVVVWVVAAGLVGSGLAVLPAAVAGLGFVVATRVVSEARIRAIAGAAALAPRLEDTGPTPAHTVLEADVEELRSLGYAVDCVATTPKGVALALLVHPDGSVATVQGHKGRPYVVLTTCLVPGERWLRTTVAANSHVGPVALVDGCRPPATASDLVARHRTVVWALTGQGVAIAPVLPGGTADDQLARRRAMARDPRAFAPRPGPAGRGRPLLEDPALPAEVAALRARQQRGIGPEGHAVGGRPAEG